jgi:hypothetical protein
MRLPQEDLDQADIELGRAVIWAALAFFVGVGLMFIARALFGR